MKPSNLTRYTFILGGRTLKYGRLRDYVCNDCGGGVTHKFTSEGDSISCAACGCDDIIPERRYLEQVSDGYEVEQYLPAPLRALLNKGDRPCQSATEAIDDLFG